MALPSISIVTPTFKRPSEVSALLENIAAQSILPAELILVDGTPLDDNSTSEAVSALRHTVPYYINYIRQDGGTAVQRNTGIENAVGDFIAFVDDDVRLQPDFLERVLDVFASDPEESVGGIVGYRTNRFFDIDSVERWRWYRRLKLLKTFEPGRYDFDCGYPVNNNMQPAFNGIRNVDFMTTACAVWRRKVMDDGLRFDPFFRDYGVLEDAHFSLRAGKRWKLLQSGDAHCTEMNSPNGRASAKDIGFKSVVNYYFVFCDIAGPLSFRQNLRFWKFQAFEVFRIVLSAIRRRNTADVKNLHGRFAGFRHLFSLRRKSRHARRKTAQAHRRAVPGSDI